MTNKCGYPDCQKSSVVHTIGCEYHWELIAPEIRDTLCAAGVYAPFNVQAIDTIISLWTKHWEEANPIPKASVHDGVYAVYVKPDHLLKEVIEDLESSLCRLARDLERLKRLIK